MPAGWALFFQGVPQTLCWLDSWVAQSSCPILLCRHGVVMVMMVVMQSMHTMYTARQAVGFWLVVSTGCAALLWSACCCGVFRCRWRFAAGILYRKWRCTTTVGVIHMCQ